jgi:hypothetical protein
MTAVDDSDWEHGGVELEVLRTSRADLHKMRAWSLVGLLL